MFRILFFVFLCAGCLLAASSPQQYTRSLGTFENPSVQTRPRFRYWLPDAGVDKEIVATNIKDSGNLGAGGVEFLPFYNYGGETVSKAPQADWVTNGFGTPAFRDVFRAALQAHKDAGLLMDFAMGPNQGQGVPAESDDEGLQWDLVPYNVEIPRNGIIDAQIPGWGVGELVAVVSALVISETNVTMPAVSSPYIPSQSGYISLVVDHKSLSDITIQVTSTGHLNATFPQPTSGIGYRIFAYYQKRTLNKNLKFENNQTATIWDNGSYIVDHYSAAGAQTVIKFWEEYILIDGLKEMLMEVGHYGWEDSIEMTSNTSWTPTIPDRFQRKLGYRLEPYLPVMNFGVLHPDNNVNIQAFQPGPVQVILNTEDSGARYINDFRELLADGYRDYLQVLSDWTRNHLGLAFSSQVSYNLPMDTATNVPMVDVPECESLQFADNIDGYRQFSGAANLAGKAIISNEMGAISAAYDYPLPRLLFSVARAVVGGVNQFVLHGQSYTGDYYITTWPGYTAFSYSVSELYSNKQPSWDHGLSEVLNYLARVQFVQRQGIPRTDVAIYNKVSATDSSFPSIYQSDDLVNDGWSWAYLTPDNFALPQATVRDNVLGPDGPRYKALVITKDSNMTLYGVVRVAEFAAKGLPIIFSGGLPSIYPSARGNHTAETLAALTKLASSPNVYNASSGHVASTLESLGLFPNIKVQTNGTIWTTWREDPSTGVDYAFIFCDSKSASAEITISGDAKKKIPYYLDAWTGIQKPVFTYTVSGSALRIPISLEGNQTTIIAFSRNPLTDSEAPTVHSTETPPSVIGSFYESAGKGWTAQVVSTNLQDSGRIRLSNNKTIELPNTHKIAELFNLSNWKLVTEHWEAPSDLYDAETIAQKHNTTHELTSLLSWTEIPALQNVSGLGYYSTTFQWPPVTGGSADGAYIQFPSILHAIRVSVNGQKLPALDYTNAKADIGPYLRHGNNDVLAVIPTTMWNYLRSIISQLRDQGGQPGLLSFTSTLPGISPNGLIGEVSVLPYVNVNIK